MPTIKRNCQCGKEFETTPQNDKKFCDAECRKKFAVIPVKQQTCERCSVVFEFKGRTRCRYCRECYKAVRVEAVTRSRVKHGKMRNPGAGSGGAQWGENNPSWKGGPGFTNTVYTGNYKARCFKNWEKVCAVCAGVDRVQVHHIDGMPKNCADDNLVPLCHPCHWKVHKKRKVDSDELARRLFEIWPGGRSKIAEKIGKAETPIRGEGQVIPDQPQRLGDEACSTPVIPPRGRDTE